LKGNKMNTTNNAAEMNKELDSIVAQKVGSPGFTNWNDFHNHVTSEVCAMLGGYEFGDELPMEKIEDIVRSVEITLLFNNQVDIIAKKVEERVCFNPTSFHWWLEKGAQALVGVGAAVVGAAVWSKVSERMAARNSDPLMNTNDSIGNPFADSTLVANPRPQTRKRELHSVPFDNKAS
jgi:hypothetical protein